MSTNGIFAVSLVSSPVSSEIETAKNGIFVWYRNHTAPWPYTMTHSSETKDSSTQRAGRCTFFDRGHTCKHSRIKLR
eukprot:6519000-Prymnesium_polylepis.1